MSSPSPGSTKRKRASSTLKSSAPNSIVTESLQHSSRDAADGEVDDSATAVAKPTTKLKKSADPTDAANPPSKRARTRSTTAGAGNEIFSDGDAKLSTTKSQDFGVSNHTMEAGVDMADNSTLKEAPPKGLDAQADRQAMPPPAKGGIVHPVGYRTNPPPKNRPVRVYADGVFDLFHLGHMRQLEQAKMAFPNTYLIVGVTGDEETHRRKGLTVLSGAERAETLRHCKWVDEVIPNCPWILTPEFMDEHQIDYVAHDDLPYGADEGDDIYKPIKEQGKFLVTQRTDGVSTTGIITKIVRDYEKYIVRQLKRGTSRQELNISWLKKNELDLKRHVNELRDQIRNNWQATGLEVSKELRSFWHNSRPNSRTVSPARGFRNASETDLHNTGPRSPGLFGRFGHLDVPANERQVSNDFATGYSLGLIGGVRSWMTKSRVRESQPSSPTGSEADNEATRSPTDRTTISRGRQSARNASNSTGAMES